ncbi:JmjC domain-containing protein [Celerinatantimonas sp. YJH-8]|uniref:JmjC domain-containing protein n=1 Tax=Celerinatantimonas sp. YJH-8 TaxID=3228714 RepID=UPI0038C37623
MKLNFDINHFMVDHWQREPILIRNAIDSFVDPLTIDELAGLAMEAEVQSRMVTIRQGNWQSQEGPFSDFTELEQPQSTLLVQATNHWNPQCSQLAALFYFIPNWRFDDVMVSYATPNGGVGPHIDQYGVFIIQGNGERHWQVGARQLLPECSNGGGLRQCAPFTPIIDETLKSGDMLYIPPGCPHHGTALTNSMSFSVGFRAPDQCELFSAFADYLLDQEQSYTRYTDPELSAGHAWGEITRHQQQKLASLFQSMVNDSRQMRDFFGRYFSETRRDIDIVPLTDDEQFTSIQQLQTQLEQGYQLRRVEGLKVLYLQGLNELFIDGESYPFEGIPNLYQWLANQMEPESTTLQKALLDTAFATLLLNWINQGYWFWEKPSSDQ